ncbi:hypothetical protein GCK72_002408 [Caenorhabditis remanei]|uniref:Uncharacterized protein n=1 Tax=Caenorhabditis remanei TaxID=31234 RepID=A0A6A5HSB1_CAERE|nr:hypothetical protein GCK72_002408 [Caenorhabditis remanei]KAF1770589.1 hypothetical protein GCK72_002408 [Caenorhabditis remanei]
MSADTSHGLTDLLHLLGSNIVNADEKAFRVFLEQLDELDEVVSLPSRSVFPNHLAPIDLALQSMNVPDGSRWNSLAPSWSTPANSIATPNGRDIEAFTSSSPN